MESIAAVALQEQGGLRGDKRYVILGNRCGEIYS
jgi:hypothetical protein